MAGILRGQQTEEGPSGRRGGAHAWRNHVPWRGQLGQPRDDSLRTLMGVSSPANVRRGRQASTVDTTRERGVQPPLAGVLAWRQGRALCQYRIELQLGQRKRCRRDGRDGRATEPDSKFDAPTLRGFPLTADEWLW